MGTEEELLRQGGTVGKESNTATLLTRHAMHVWMLGTQWMAIMGDGRGTVRGQELGGRDVV